MRLNNWDQRQLDIESGKQLDAAALSEDRVVAEPVRPFAWAVKNDHGHWFVTADQALASTWRNAERLDVVSLYTAPPDSAPSGGAVREALLLGREAVVESFDYAKTVDETYLAEARLRDIDAALTAPSGDAVREALERIPSKMFWLLGKGITRPDEPLYGMQIRDPDTSETVAESEDDDLVGCINKACATLTAPGASVGENEIQNSDGTVESRHGVIRRLSADTNQVASAVSSRPALQVRKFDDRAGVAPGPSDPTPQDAKADAGDLLCAALNSDNAGDLLSYCRDDAAKWAAAFCRTAERLGIHGIDEDWIIGWFANAIETAYSLRTLPPSASKPVTVEEIAREWQIWSEFVSLCEHYEDEAEQKIAAGFSGDKAEHEHGFWRGQKIAAKNIRRAVRHPKYRIREVTDAAPPLRYRPLEFDDWGIIRRGDSNNIFAVVRRPISTEEEDAHRKNGTDPFEDLARILMNAHAVNEVRR